jgi:hypothetical protein
MDKNLPRFDNRVISAGKVPVNGFSPIRKSVKLTKSPINVDIVPVIIFLSNRNSFNGVATYNSFGIVPVIALLWSWSFSKLLNRPILVGIVPESIFLYIINDVSCVLLANNDAGIVPTRLLLANQSSANEEPLPGANISGIVPVKALSDTRYDDSSGSVEISKNAGPVNIFSSISMIVKEVNNDSAVGNAPPIMLAWTSSDIKAVNIANSDGNSPLKLFWAKGQ